MPTYETQTDKNNEADFALQLERAGCSVQHLPQYYPFDFFVQYNGRQAFIEYKRRNHRFGTFPTAYFPAAKLATCRSWARELGIDFFIYMQWDDQIRYCNAMCIQHSISLAGRNDRQTEDTFEPMVEINIEYFNKFCDQ